jgi:hypothetical protein
MKQVWEHSSTESFAYRKIYDVRLAKTLQHNGVTRFATRNLRDFKNLGFKQLWDPFK